MFLERGGANIGKINLKKLFTRLFRPFLIVEFFLLIIYLLYNIYTHDSLLDALNSFIISGGIGPGSYFPWVYLQFLLFLYWIRPIFVKMKNKYIILLIFILLSMGLEIAFSFINLNYYVYRITFFRYIFLYYFIYLIISEGIKIEIKRILLGLVSLIFIILFYYSDINFYPYFYGYAGNHWICYPYLIFILLPIYYILYIITNHYSYFLNAFIQKCGKLSYEIFLFQMVYFAIFPKIIKNNNIFFMILSIILCIFLPIILNSMIKRCKIEKE